MGDWIKCSERMPQNDDTVLILTGYMQTAYWCAEENQWNWGDEYWFPEVVTHWQPLPAPPKD